jgi:hypothetical protein
VINPEASGDAGYGLSVGLPAGSIGNQLVSQLAGDDSAGDAAAFEVGADRGAVDLVASGWLPDALACLVELDESSTWRGVRRCWTWTRGERRSSL